MYQVKRRLALHGLQLRSAATVFIVIAASVACGGSSSTSTATPAASATAVASSGTPPRGPGNRTPSADVQTSVAEGTPRGFGNRTPPPEIQTSVAEGTPAQFGNRTPSAGMQTSIAEGTPASAFRGPGGGRGVVTTVAAILAIDQAQLVTELRASGATIASVAAAHGHDRSSLRQALIDATRQRVSDAVTNGTLTQGNADQTRSQFEATVDSVLDSSGGSAPQPAGQ